MNQTIANEVVLKAAEMFLAANQIRPGGDVWIPAKAGTAAEGTSYNLAVAIRKVRPRVERMRQRLDKRRAANAKRCRPFAGPEWLKKAIDSMP